MGSKISPILANIIMENLEIEVRNNIFKKIKVRVHNYYRFVDDIFTIMPTEYIQEIKKYF